jgi:hypothetical protein
MSASVAVAGSVPFGAHAHAGSQVFEPTAAPRMNKQSDATGDAPELTGCAHSPAAQAKCVCANEETRPTIATRIAA